MRSPDSAEHGEHLNSTVEIQAVTRDVRSSQSGDAVQSTVVSTTLSSERTADEGAAASDKTLRDVGSQPRLSTTLREAWAHRELLYFLSWRDIKVRYKQTALGILWAVIQPLFTMALFTILFGRIANIPTDGVPRPVFYFSALLPWLYISTTVTNASMSLVSNTQLITKIYFPRVMLPAATALSGLVDFLIGSLLLVGFLLYYHIHLSWDALLWPVLVVEMMVLALALSLILSALNVKYRDVKYVVPFAVQIWMFLTPIIYPASLVPPRFQHFLALNPAAGVVEAFRHTLAPNLPMRWDLLWISTVMTAVLLVIALAFFNRAERAFADVI